MDENKQSKEAFKAQNLTREEAVDQDEEGDGGEAEEDGADEQSQASRVDSSTKAESRCPQNQDLGTASSVQFAEDDRRSGVPVYYALQKIQSAEELKDQDGEIKKKGVDRVGDQVTQARQEIQLQIPDNPSSSELSPTSVTQSILSIPSPTLPEQKSSSLMNGNSMLVPQVEKSNSSGPEAVTVVPVLNEPSSDGYNWRKYGQKQVKSPQGSRSYYRCTYSDCYAKKIECSDHSNRVIEIVYRSQHNHNPPRKLNCSRESRLASSHAHVEGNNDATQPVKTHDSLPSSSSKKSIHDVVFVSEEKQKESTDSDDNAEINIEGELDDEPEQKKRLKKTALGSSRSQSKLGKKPKFVVHAAGDVGISGDGYRWRKYGQKMVKGNPHPRNYYRCTSAGCPVRKHIERAVDNESALIITYKGIHDHDMPVPKKRHGPPSAPLVAAAAPVSMSNLQVKNPFNTQKSATQWSVDKEGELTGEALDLGGEKAIESARTLLSIGFEIKPC